MDFKDFKTFKELLPTNFEDWALYGTVLYASLHLILLVQWSISLGMIRGGLALLCRLAWTLPIVLAFFPKTDHEPLPRTVALKSIRVLLDDSVSMSTSQKPTLAEQSGIMIQQLESECQRLGCSLKTTKLSDLDPTVARGWTPLSKHLDTWIYKNPQEPWILITDGADSQPSEPWKSTLKGSGSQRGMIVGFQDDEISNLWLKTPKIAPFSFENKPLTVQVTLGRSHYETEEIVQVQLVAAPQPPVTVNVKFRAGEQEVIAETVLPSLPKGQHLIEIRALPLASEAILWDNVAFAQIEVLPNTFGVLHLLGSPSWDGRFLRRYLKGEPKYDLISFFILRDPWDSQQVNERELSLIPFPVERLFKEELPNFRVVIIQNFTLFQFLLPEYQANLVRFVQNGGGLLFLGGPRALTSSDLINSPLKSILPFEIDEKMSLNNPGGFGLDPWDLDQDTPSPMTEPEKPSDLSIAYDPKMEFKIEMGVPEANQRALANVYDDWDSLSRSLGQWSTARGIHRMDRARFRAKESTVLLYGIPTSPQTAKIPLAVASYPGKGRALWLFSDTFWRLGMTMDQDVSRQVYNQFMHSAMTWLMRQDLKKPLIAKSLTFASQKDGPPSFRVTLQGPSVRYFQLSEEWKVTACGNSIPPDKLLVHRHGDTEIELSAQLPTALIGGTQCPFSIDGNHAAFGSVKAAITGVFPETYRDSELHPAPHKLGELSQLAESKLILIDTVAKDRPSPQLSDPKAGPQLQAMSLDQGLDEMKVWVSQVTGQEGVSLPTRFRTIKDYYWSFNRQWIIALFLLIPLEVLLRRWDQLVSRGRFFRS